MDLDEVSERLFGRRYALAVYLAVSALPERFTATQVRELSGAPGPHVSRELKLLRELGLAAGKRESCVKTDSPFWAVCESLARVWTNAALPSDIVAVARRK